jgi:hypothetical protein
MLEGAHAADEEDEDEHHGEGEDLLARLTQQQAEAGPQTMAQGKDDEQLPSSAVEGSPPAVPMDVGGSGEAVAVTDPRLPPDLLDLPPGDVDFAIQGKVIRWLHTQRTKGIYLKEELRKSRWVRVGWQRGRSTTRSPVCWRVRCACPAPPQFSFPYDCCSACNDLTLPQAILLATISLCLRPFCLQ